MCDTVVLKDDMKVSQTTGADATPRDARTEMPVQNQPSSSEAQASPSLGHPGRHLKIKLVRSLAVCEESEPAAAPQDEVHLRVALSCDKEELTEKKDDSRKENECNKEDKPEQMLRTLSRESSQDYTDSTGIDLHEFLVNTLKNNPRDRMMLLKLEQDLLDFISNNDSQKRKFPPMTSYHRMLLHRVAAYFGLEHNVDPSGKSVIISKTTSTRIPDQTFSEHIKDDREDDFQRRYILTRDDASEDSQCVTGDYFNLDGRLQNEETRMSTQQRRQIFRLRAGRSGNSWQSSSETEAPRRHGDLRPWSSTDSSDSSHRPAPRPATIAKASSYGGTTSGLVRGDKSTAPLSRAGSGSSSSVASSSSSSLSRPQHPLPASAPSRANSVPSPVASHPAADTRVPRCSDTAKSRPARPPPSATSFYLLPLETPKVATGSFLLSPLPGQAFVSPDGSAVLYNTSSPAPGTTSTVGTQQGKTPHQSASAAATAQQQPANHLLSQPICPSLQPVQYTTVAHHPPPLLPSSQFLTVFPNQQQYTVPDALSAQFSHLSLVRQPGGNGGPLDTPPCSALYHHSSPLQFQGAPPPPQQVAGYVLAGPPGMLPGLQVPAYPSTGLGPPLTQQHTYNQQPVQRVVCYCAPAHYPHCPSQHQQLYRTPFTPLPYNMPPQQAYPTMMSNPMPACQPVVGVQPTSNPALACSSQQSNMGTQMQGMMVQYPPVPSYQVAVPPVSQQQMYQQPLVVPYPSTHGAMATMQPLVVPYPSTHGAMPTMQPLVVPYPSTHGAMPTMHPLVVPYPSTHGAMPTMQSLVVPYPSSQGAVPMATMQPCYSFLPPTQHTTMSSSMGFVPPSALEQMQPQASSPCVSQQQYIGVHPPPPGGGLVMMQLPSGHQPHRTHSLCQRRPGHNKYPVLDHQRSRRPTAERLAALDNSQSSSQPVSPVASTSPGLLGSLTGLSSGLPALIPTLAPHHPQQQLPPAFCLTGPGEVVPHY